MNRFITVLLALIALFSSAAQSEVGETNVIDAIAAKPNSTRAILLLHQLRPWNDESMSLLQRKLAFYSEAIRSESLVNQRPGLKGKSFRIIVLYADSPSAPAEEALNKLKADLLEQGVSLLWGTQRQLAALAEAA